MLFEAAPAQGKQLAASGLVQDNPELERQPRAACLPGQGPGACKQQQLNQRLLDRLTPFAGAGSVGLSASAASATTAVRWATALREAL